MAQLARAGAGEHKAQIPPLLHQAMHHVEQLGRLLNLIDHHSAHAGLGLDPLPQPLRPRLIGTQHLRSQ